MPTVLVSSKTTSPQNPESSYFFSCFPVEKYRAMQLFLLFLYPYSINALERENIFSKNKDCLQMNPVPFPGKIKTFALLTRAAALNRNGLPFICRSALIILSFAAVEPSENRVCKTPFNIS
ncbi:hypothetical protein [Flavisolibacter ginsenosidimutans]|uniref:Uncharacterized protein n=1 Tax=Flavisolibacter ginsenosidimutans TaxID=661481 RepID=A0A5B8UGF9_9BACT|nr:hypothetical protein [Flavisolibacter ginsenosidimutans]QEC55588.1 hypothetical protein FSB75_06640 [Flavisolibacter ginsenosidimutans]